MILVIPSIELKHGKCIHCICGEDGSEAIYNKLADNPIELCRLLRRENAKSIHITDFDSILFNLDINKEKIIEYAKSVDIPVQVKAKFSGVDECRHLLEKGVYRVIVCDIAFANPELVRQLIDEYLPSRIAFCLNSSSGKIKIHSTGQVLTDREYITFIKELGGDRVMYQDSDWQDSDKTPDFHYIVGLAEEMQIKICVANGVKRVEDLWELNKLSDSNQLTLNKVDSAIIGKPMFDNIFPCQKIWRLIESRLEA